MVRTRQRGLAEAANLRNAGPGSQKGTSVSGSRCLGFGRGTELGVSDGSARTTTSVVEWELGKTRDRFGGRVDGRGLAGFGRSDRSMQRRRLLRKADGGLVACGWFPGVVANDSGVKGISVLGAPGRNPTMCRRTSVCWSIFGIGTRLRATLVWRLLGRLFREGKRRSSGRSASSEVEAPRSSRTSASAGGRVDHVRQNSSEVGRTRIEG